MPPQHPVIPVLHLLRQITEDLEDLALDKFSRLGLDTFQRAMPDAAATQGDERFVADQRVHRVLCQQWQVLEPLTQCVEEDLVLVDELLKADPDQVGQILSSWARAEEPVA